MSATQVKSAGLPLITRIHYEEWLKKSVSSSVEDNVVQIDINGIDDRQQECRVTADLLFVRRDIVECQHCKHEGRGNAERKAID